MFNTEDTIVAISSAAGPAARSIVRLSGPQAIGLGSGVFRIFRRGRSGRGDGGESLESLPGFAAAGGMVKVGPPQPLEAPARAYLFRAPRSYTRQDVLELHVPGEAVASVVHAAMLSAGARQAGPGEFTARAFFSGRLDLSSAEAVADIVDAEADAQLRSAVGMLEGALARLCRPPAEALTDALATTEASIDFAEQDIQLCPPGELAERIARVADDLTAALARAGRWAPSTREPKVAIAGRPNAGKSSLLNVLSGVDRAIVSALAGTTRDVLSAPARLADGREVLLQDAAGLVASADPLARAASRAARDAVAGADVVLFVIDAAGGDHDADATLLEEVAQLIHRAPVLVLANKVDLLGEAGPPAAALERRLGRRVLPVSAATGAGLDKLRAALAGTLADVSAPQPSRLLLHDRQRRMMADAAGAARRGTELLRPTGGVLDVAELLSVELRAALAGLGELTGEVVTEDVLSAIFSRFCVGK